jgi:hypothetical protein
MNRHTDERRLSQTTGRVRRAVVVGMGAALLGLSVMGSAGAVGRTIVLDQTRFATPVCYNDLVGTFPCHPVSSTGTFFVTDTNSG